MAVPTDGDLVEMLSSITKHQAKRIELLEKSFGELADEFILLMKFVEENARKNKEWIEYFNKRIGVGL